MGCSPITIQNNEEKWFCGVVVITSALHAEGREFEPRQNLRNFCLLEKRNQLINNLDLLWGENERCLNEG